jgi:hydroxyacylglutathione hydrolase
MLTISPVRAFSDNYIWVLHNQTDAIAIDPGEAKPLLAFLDAQQLNLQGVLITHRHQDHIGGLPELLRRHPTLPIYGPPTLAEVSHVLRDGDQFQVLGTHFDVIAVPGHTLDHLSYYSAPNLFCGDTLFGAGCGRLFEGTPQQMLDSLTELANLPPDTQIYPAHEYTVANLYFAQAVEPNNDDIKQRLNSDRVRQNNGFPTLPSTLALEQATNPFLRTSCNTVKSAATHHANRQINAQDEIFAELRAWKNGFRHEIDQQ